MANIWKPKRDYVEKNYGKDLTEYDASILMWDSTIKHLFEKYKDLDTVGKKEFKPQAESIVKDIVIKIGYKEAVVKLIPKGFEILSGHTKLVARGNGGALYSITWDDEV